ncbi:hypothetical protein QBC47DRAFT_399858 [Echria macrotheca]|uniref:N-acetyltransferase domain-containing protein n=1 Tax=Echria macrotheca TaxID=438768 RepID=A0AAJ0BHZ1_9PEZI|nr:hypothetical protein QBC47DRAFT_399858 [Echria macrotheca]
METGQRPTRDGGGLANDLIAPLRDASRKLVREWGFLRPTFAGSNLSPGAVHCLVEIGDNHVGRFSDLCNELKTSRKQLTHILSELAHDGSIVVDKPRDGEKEGMLPDPEATYRLTPAGALKLNEINAYAQNQVMKALATAQPDAAANITTAFRLYATALEQARLAEAVTTPGESRPATPELTTGPPAPSVTISRGYRPGLLGRTLEMHMNYYHKTVGWGREFETGLGSSLSNLISRLDRPVNEVWTAVQTTPAHGTSRAVEHIVGVVYIDGEIPGREGASRLRAFIIDESARGLGLGKKLMAEAMTFVRESGFLECRLSTMRTLLVARKLYEQAGFVIEREELEEAWGQQTSVMTYVWHRERQPDV